ncbi:hypothetical protein [Halothermothrix orenii]|uniref:Uncharacterized protein n=1 Tax=Halothermothrix orenii (strain H 168 / OCM 544 / DSM 9562) TaxID=373903 RepID=B8CW57_HALOH|nr:hypothetical protein [Halothermothrix orenii]ACL69526.1 hypothetical protein Hore_07690 [Halothermothrix orenii H 168]
MDNYLIGSSPDSVKKHYEKKGKRVIVNQTKPPDKKEGYGEKRVIAIKEIDSEQIKIIWSYEKYR